METIGAFWKKAEEFSSLGRPTIAFGLNSPDEEIVESLVRSRKYADILLVGPSSIDCIAGFKLVIDEQPEDRLASMLACGQVDGIVRGTIDDKKTLHAYQRLTKEVDRTCPGLFEEPRGKQFFICPVSNTDGWSREERFQQARDTATFIREWDIEPLIAVYTGIRHDTYPCGLLHIDQTFVDANWIVEKLSAENFTARNSGIDLDISLASEYNIHVPVNGMVGNQLFRALVFCGGRVLTATRIGFSRPYEDNARSERDFYSHIFWLAAYINKKKFGSGHTV